MCAAIPGLAAPGRGSGEPVLRPFLGVEAGYLDAALDSIQRSHGSFDVYRECELGRRLLE
jgi:hypothetical protein